MDVSWSSSRTCPPRLHFCEHKKEMIHHKLARCSTDFQSLKYTSKTAVQNQWLWEGCVRTWYLFVWTLVLFFPGICASYPCVLWPKCIKPDSPGFLTRHAETQCGQAPYDKSIPSTPEQQIGEGVSDGSPLYPYTLLKCAEVIVFQGGILMSYHTRSMGTEVSTWNIQLHKISSKRCLEHPRGSKQVIGNVSFPWTRIL